MSEISKFEAYKKKLDGICEENHLVAKFACRSYPITLTIRPLTGLEEQLSMLEEEETEYISPDASLVFAMSDGNISYRMSKTFTISDALFSKLKNLFKNMHSCYTQYFFRNVIERGIISKGMMPVIDESLAEDEVEPTECTEAMDGKTENDEAISIDDFLFRQAVTLVRAENKATTALLQRRLNIGYAKAGQLIHELEERGVIGPYNGSEPRAVLPYDLPDDSEEVHHG